MRDAASFGARWTLGGVIAAVIIALLQFFPEPIAFIRRVLDLKPEPIPVKVVEWPEPPVITVTVTAAPPVPTTTTKEFAPAGVILPKRPAPNSRKSLLNPNLRVMESGSWPWALIVYGESYADDVAAAASMVLRQSGRTSVRLFGSAATEVRLAPDLFQGSPALGAELQLARYCVRLLVGRLRTSVTDSDGSLIGEATVTFRLLTPEGEIVSTHEISAKGGGPTTHEATERAVAELCQTLPEQMSEILQ